MITLPPVVRRRRFSYPPRSHRNGHIPDCPYHYRKIKPEFCPVCRGDEKGAPK